MIPRLLIATKNAGKREEMAAILVRLGVAAEVVTDVDWPDVEETGETLEENALLKARAAVEATGLPSLADDTGLEVEALGGAPGVYSARFAGANATDAENNRLLLEKLADVPLARRGARYVCHVALADPQGEIRAESRDYCSGRVRFEGAGTNGFGYDPLFEVVEYHRTYGELGPHVKRALSHRSRAIRAIVPRLIALGESGEWAG